MLRVIEVAFTGYPVTDMPRARSFYEGTLGLESSRAFEHEGKSWVEYDIGPATLAISDMEPQWKPATDGPSVALEVEDFDASIQWLKEKGVLFMLEPFASPICRMAIIADPEGNALTIHKRNPA
ncbi:MAG: VOC family protein [Verrucomicrobiota bacterium]|nr:VOC family protein [Verrucomicrobiota bacterium]